MSTTLALVGTVVEHVTTTGGIKTGGGVQALTGQIHAIENPFVGVVPNFSVLGVEFNALWKKVFGAVWAVVMVVIGARLVTSFMEMASHKGGGHPQQLAESRSSTINAGMAMGAMIAFGALMSAVFAVVG